MKIIRGLQGAFIVAAGAALVACGSSTGPGGASMSVRMHDASGQVKSAWVSVTKVYADGPNGRVDLTGSSSGMIELTSLQGGNSVEIASATGVDVGTYTDVHVVFGDAAIQTLDGTVYGTSADLNLPGVSASITASLACSSCGGDAGVQVALPGGSFDARADASNTLVVDFDLSQSVSTTLTGSLSLRPVLVGSDRQNDTGVIAGGVTAVRPDGSPWPLQCGGHSIAESDFYADYFVPQATAEDSTDGNGNAYVKSGSGSSDGAYTIPGLPKDDYSLDAVGSFGFDNGDRLTVGTSPDSSTVHVTTSDTSRVDFREAVTCDTTGG